MSEKNLGPIKQLLKKKIVEYGRKKGVVKSVEKTSNNSMPKREKSNPLNMKNMLTSNILRSHTYGVKY